MAETQNNVVWYNRADSALYTWENQFMVTVSENELALGIDAGELEQIQDAGTVFIDAMNALNLARGAYAAAVQAKDAAREALINTNRIYVAQFQTLPNLDPKIIEQLDIPQRSGSGSRSFATTPTNLVANVTSLGNVSIKFNRAGNSGNTVFTVEKSTNSGATWSTAFSSTRTRVKLSGYTAGQTVWFRVYATRNNTVSAPTVPVMIWPTEGAGSVNLEIAA